MRPALNHLLLLALAVALGALGAVPVVDHMTHTVLRIVEPIALADWHRPYWNPAPMDAWGVRPISVLLMKGVAALAPSDRLPAPGLVALLGIPQLAAFGLGAHAWLRRWGLDRVALPAAAGAMMLAPTLFSAWYLPELDALGAGLLLGGLAFLARPEPLGWRWAPALLLLGLGLFLKESSGLVGLALLAAGAVGFGLRRDGARALRHGVPLLFGLNLWVLLAGPLLGDDRSMMARHSTWDRLPVVEHDAVQLLYLASLAGACLIALGATPRSWRRGRRPALALALAPAGALLLLLIAPIATFYSHYEAVYYAPRALASLGAVVLMAGLLAHTLGARRAPGRAQVAGGPLAVYAAITAASLFASSAREDMASRIFLVAAPMLLALALDSGRRLWRDQGALPRPLQTPARAATAALLLAVAWYPLASATNTVQDWRSRHAVDAPARTWLADQPLEDSVLLSNHYVWWLGAAELVAAGAPVDVATRTRFSVVPAWLTQPELPTMDWGHGAVDAEQAWRSGAPVRLYWLARTWRGEPAAGAHLLGDLSWTRRNSGLFTPLLAAVDAPRGPDGQIDASRLTRPLHNLPEDLQMTTWLPGPTPLEALADARGATRWSAEAGAIGVPLDLWSLPRRLVQGVPILETYTWTARVHQLSPPAEAQP